MKCWVLLLFAAVAGARVSGEELLTFPENVQSRGQGRIVSGWEAREGQFPYQVALRMVTVEGRVGNCGASIVHEQWAISAAHCTATHPTMVLSLGTTNLTRPHLLFESTIYYNHPWFNERTPTIVQRHDVSLIKFPIRVQFNALVQPVRLQRFADRNRNYHDERLVATGWGRLWTSGQSPEVMNWVYLLGVSNEVCRNRYSNSPIIADSTICARYYNVTSQSICQGDSGGALVATEADGEVTLVGISSFTSGDGCHLGWPAGFIRPGHYHDWYLDVTGVSFDWEPLPPTTQAPTTQPPTEPPTTQPPTEPPTTQPPTEPPTTQPPTEPPTTQPPTEPPTTQPPTEPPTTQPPTEPPTTQPPTEPPTTQPPTEPPTTQPPTEPPTTQPPTEPPTTQPPTEPPTTQPPTEPPTTQPPTEPPTTQPPTEPPTTQPPTEPPTTQPPTEPPTTQPPTEPPTTQPPTEPPTTQPPTEPPTTQPPTTQPPTTEGPTDAAETTLGPTSESDEDSSEENNQEVESLWARLRTMLHVN